MEKRGFSLIELTIVLACIGGIFATSVAVFSDAGRDANDKQRIADLHELASALHAYKNEHGVFPREQDGANGNSATNETLRTLLGPYLRGVPRDPRNDETFFYYYDGAHRCGEATIAILFARHMENGRNANFTDFERTVCGMIVDGEGRGGGSRSFNVMLGESGG